METDFKYSPIDQNGGSTVFMSKKGRFGKDALKLDDCELAYSNILEVSKRDKDIVLVIEKRKGLTKHITKALIEGQFLILRVSKISSLTFEKQLNKICSSYQIESLKAELAAEGRLHEFRSVNCPNCKSEVNLTPFEQSEYVYCNYCESVFTESGKLSTNGHVHKCCEECGMFDEIKDYTEFYFYFLLVIYGYSYKKRFVCKNCANGIFWKTLLINSIFILGIIPSLAIKVKIMSSKEPRLKALSKAVKLSLKGKYRDASIYYNDMYRSMPSHPALLFNEGMGHLIGGDGEGSMRKIEECLKSCGNYIPALVFLNNLNQNSRH